MSLIIVGICFLCVLMVFFSILSIDKKLGRIHQELVAIRKGERELRQPTPRVHLRQEDPC